MRFELDGRAYEVRHRVAGGANTVWELEVDGERRCIKVPLTDPMDIPKSFGEAEVLAQKLARGDVETQKLVADLAGSPA